MTRNIRRGCLILLSCMAMSWLKASLPTDCQTESSILSMPKNYIGSSFGRMLKQDGEWMAVYAYDLENGYVDSGAIFMYRNHNGAWEFFQKLKSSSLIEYAQFGNDFALSGNRLIATYYDSQTADCRCHIYEFDGFLWNLADVVDIEDGHQTQMNFSNLALVDNRMFFSIWNPTNGEAQHITIYEKAGDQWVLSQQVFAPEPAMSYFGSRIAAGDNMFATSGRNSSGQRRVYVFRKCDGVWTYESQLAASDEHVINPVNNYGASLSVDGHTLVVGNMSRNVSTGIAAGAVYVYEHTDGQWIEIQKLSNPGPYNGGSEWFGYSIAVENGVLAIGAINDTPSPSTVRCGSVYVYLKSLSGVWNSASWHGPSNPDASQYFGNSVAIAGRSVLVGSPLRHVPDAGFIGGVYQCELPLPAATIQSALLYGDALNPVGVVQASVKDFDPTGSTFYLERLFGNVWGEVDRKYADTRIVPELIDASRWTIRESSYAYQAGYQTADGTMAPLSETVLASPAADLNHDGAVNGTDWKIFNGLLGLKHDDPKWNPQADLVRDGIINEVDIVAFKTWMKCVAPTLIATTDKQ